MAINIVWTSADGNVSATSSYNGAALPIVNDDLSLPASNNQSLITNLAALNAIDLDLLYVDGGFGGAVGSDGTPFEISADLVKFFGAQAFHYKGGEGALTTDFVLIQASNPSTIITLDGDMTRIIANKGNVVIKSSASTVTDLDVGWVTNRRSDVTLTLQGGGTLDVTTMKASGGVINANAAITTAFIDGANYTQDVATVTNVDIFSGDFNYKTGGATIGLLNMRGGKTNFTLTDLQKTLTNGYRWPGSQFEFIEETTTFTNPVFDMRIGK